MRTLFLKSLTFPVIYLLLCLSSCREYDAPEDKFKNGREVVDTAAIEPAEVTWRKIDLNIPDIVYPEITSKATVVRSNGDYSVYSVGENTIFLADTAVFLKNAHSELQQIAASVKMRYPGGKLRIYGLSGEKNQQRADSLKTWFVKNGGIDSVQISVHPVKPGNSISNAETTYEKPKNPRIEIAVIPAQKK